MQAKWEDVWDRVDGCYLLSAVTNVGDYPFAAIGGRVADAIEVAMAIKQDDLAMRVCELHGLYRPVTVFFGISMKYILTPPENTWDNEEKDYGLVRVFEPQGPFRRNGEEEEEELAHPDPERNGNGIADHVSADD